MGGEREKFMLIKSDLCERFLEIYKYGWVSKVLDEDGDDGFRCKNSSIDLFDFKVTCLETNVCQKSFTLLIFSMSYCSFKSAYFCACQILKISVNLHKS
jgi:hypothetical protein